MFEKIFLKHLFFLLIPIAGFSFDTTEARKIIRKLCAPPYHGRGYYKKGVTKASVFLEKQLKKSQAKPLFGISYYTSFSHAVNVFIKDPILVLNGKKLLPGRDFILDPSFPSIQIDTVFSQPLKGSSEITFKGLEIKLNFKNKLTWGVSTKHESKLEINILRGVSDTILKSLILKCSTKLEENFTEKIIAGYHEGAQSDSMIVFTAHYDHLGRMGPSALFAGANDNASGTSMVVLMSRYFHPSKRHSSKYKLVYIFFPAEEAGLLGSKYFVDNPPFDLGKIKFLINLDLLGTGEEGIMVVNATEFKREFALLNNINNEFHMVNNIRSRGPAANSDHYWFYKKGVPCFFIYTLGGNAYYHDVYDLPNSLSLYAYTNVFNLLLSFIQKI